MTQVEKLQEMLEVAVKYEKGVFNVIILNNELAHKRRQYDYFELLVLFKHIRSDKYFEEHGSDNYLVSFDGRAFYEKGGYIEQERQQQIQEEKKRQREQLEERQFQSVIETNESVKDTNKIQKIVGYGSLGLGAVSTLFIAVTIFQQCNDKTEQRLQDIHKAMQQTKTSLDSIVLYQGRLDSSIHQIRDSAKK